MKKLITLVLGIAFIYSCSTSSDENGNASTSVTDIDGNVYQTIIICDRTWTKSNLNVSKYSDGTPIPQVTDPNVWMTLRTGAWRYYNNDPANGPIYGKLYNWYAVAGIHDNDPNTPNKILAPIGWHVPSDTEWTTLITCLGGPGGVGAGGPMSEIGTEHWTSPNSFATNSSGFTALPGGMALGMGGFDYISSNGWWWSSSSYFSPPQCTNCAWALAISSGSGANLPSIDRGHGLSVRYIKD